jgi:hypothetical protein
LTTQINSAQNCKIFRRIMAHAVNFIPQVVSGRKKLTDTTAKRKYFKYVTECGFC